MKNKFIKKALFVFTAMAMALSLMTGIPFSELGLGITVSAEESTSTLLSVTTFATPQQLMSSFDLDGTNDTLGKVYFGTNGNSQQTWYIAGSDADNSIVLLCDPMLPMTTGCFDDKSDLVDNAYKTYDNNWNCTYGTAPSQVYANHYGASDLRLITLPSLESSAFSTSEQDMMLATKVYTDDDMLRDECNSGYASEYTYYTTDKLYAAYGVYEEAIITVGENSADSLNSGLKVSLTSGPYTNDDVTKFYLRTPYLDQKLSVHNVSPLNDNVGCASVKLSTPYAVVPAFRLNLASVLFASAAPAATSAASLTDTMTFRVDGENEIKSEASYITDGVYVDVAEEETVYLYVQGNDGTNDWVYSQKISEDGLVEPSSIMAGAKNANGATINLSTLDLSQCKIWLEKSDNNLAYAVIVHIHEWKYSASGDTITAVCVADDCPATGTNTIVISASDKTYDGTAVTATVEKTGILENEEVTVNYYQGDTLIGTDAPVDVGTYTAKITYEEVTASVTYTINNNNNNNNNNSSSGGSSSSSSDESPNIEGKNGKKGWSAISDVIEDTKEGEKVVIDMNDATEIPRNILSEIKGKDITIVLNMDNGFIWTINGKDVENPEAIDMGVKKGTRIPMSVINAVTGEREYIEITLSHNGDFGFKAVLTVDMGKNNKGNFANLYYYNKFEEETEIVSSDEIDENGNADLTFTHASEYVIVIDDTDHTDLSAGESIKVEEIVLL